MDAIPQHRLRDVGINILVLIFTLLVVWGILEVFLRISGIQEVVPLNPPAFRTSSDAALSYELIPSIHASVFGASATINNLGFRSPPLDSTKPLVAMLGDSVTFGHGVSDSQTTSAYLQKMLTGASVLNAGVSGYNIDQEAEQFTKRILPLHPRLVILTFVFNDFDETLKLDEQGYFLPRSSTTTVPYKERLRASIDGPGLLPIPGKLFLQLHSAVFTFIERITKQLPWRRHAPQENIFKDSVTGAQLASYKQTFDRLNAGMGMTSRVFVIWPENALHIASRKALRSMAEADGWKVIDLYDIYGNTYESLGWDSHPDARTNARTAYVIDQALQAWHMIPH